MVRYPVVRVSPDGTTVVELSGEIDLSTAPEATRSLDAATQGPRPRVVVDLRGVTFMDCRGVTALVRARVRALESDGQLGLVITSPFLLRILRLVDLLDSFSIYPDVATALASMEPVPSRSVR